MQGLNLKALLILLQEKHGIDLQIGLVELIKKMGGQAQKYGVAIPVPNVTQAFDFNDAMCQGKVQGLLTHGQVRTDKDDVQPQPELIQMLLTL